ncbi:MAG TPA: SRPBCC domain-containing protein [Ktedonobacterales bacterium]
MGDTGVVRQVDSPRNVLIMTSDYDCSAQQLFANWTTPELLTKWWPQEAEIAAHAGGSYHLAWPRPDWHLVGSYVAFDPGVCLAFTWNWRHEPKQPTRYVVVTFAALSDGEGGARTRLTVTHSLYGEEQEEQDQRQSHFDGWMHFLAQLHDC